MALFWQDAQTPLELQIIVIPERALEGLLKKWREKKPRKHMEGWSATWLASLSKQVPCTA
jgi:hypothetical protein